MRTEHSPSRFGRFLLSGGLALLMLSVFAATAAAQTETVEYYGLDALGSVRVIVDQNGQPIDRMDYGPFGENLKAAIKMAFEQYAQLARDAETGQDYAEARNYAASTGRFNRVDPAYAGLFDPQGWNRYSYAANRPMTHVDPDGRNPLPAGAGFFGLAVVRCATAGICAVFKTQNEPIDTGADDGMRVTSDHAVEQPGGWSEWLGGAASAAGSFVMTVLDEVLGTEGVGGAESEITPTPKSSPSAVITTAATITAVVVGRRVPRVNNAFSSVSRRMVSANGRVIPVPKDWVGRTSDNGKGIVYQRPGATGNADMIRIMDPTYRYPNGYVRIHNGHGQPVDVNGKPGSKDTTHIPLEHVGQIKWPWW